MSFASKGYVDGKVRAVDSKYAELITSGTHRQGVWNAATNTPTLSPNSGTNGFWYDVSVEGDWDGRHWRVGDKIIFNSITNKWDQIPTGVEKDDQPMLIGFLNENSSFPTTRPSGKPLLVGDYLKVDSAAVLPFEIDDGTGTKILFDSYMDEAEWNGSRFQEKSYKAGMTNEVGVKSPTEESLSEEAVYQNQVNKEFKERLKNIGEFVNVGNSFENVEKNEKFLYYLEKDWEKEDTNSYLCFTSMENDSSIGYVINGSLDADINISRDNISWEQWDGTTIILNQGESIYVWNKNNTLSTSDENYLQFIMTGHIEGSNNIMSMVNFSELSPYCFYKMFMDCTALYNGPDLPSANLKSYCYSNLFNGCTSFDGKISLWIDSIEEYSCYRMYKGCSSLSGHWITDVYINTEDLYEGCFKEMFCDDYSFSRITLMYSGYFNSLYFENWMLNVSTTGLFRGYNGPDISNRGPSAIPENWELN